MDKQNVIDYYNEFIREQVASGINDRIYHLYKRLLRLGLQSGSSVLELGCGIGTMTYLLSKQVRKGVVEAVDISPESIKFAQHRIRQSNISFVASDIVSYQPGRTNFDFILLFDIIEHIPTDRHKELFENLGKIAGEHTRILINIPNPAYIEYDMKYNPDALQIIDQPLPLDFLLNHIQNSGLALISFEHSSIWVEKDYQFFVLEKKKDFKEIIVNSKRSFVNKAIKRLQRMYVKRMYTYR